MQILGSVTCTVLQLKTSVFVSTLSKISKSSSVDMKRTLLPVDTLFTWVIVALSTLLALKIIGLDPSPLLTVGSVSGIVVGFASQQLLLYVTAPFMSCHCSTVQHMPFDVSRKASAEIWQQSHVTQGHS